MRDQRRDVQFQNRSYQQQIALSLIGTLGVDGAIDACCRNRWDGTLQAILTDKRNFRGALSEETQL